MSAYTAAVQALAPWYYWPLSETSGTTFADLGQLATRAVPQPQPLTKNGTVSLGVPSLLPGDPTNGAIAQTQDVHAASRAHNALLDQPNQPGKKLSLNVWARPDRLEAAGSQVLFSKPNTYQLLFEGSKIRFDIGSSAGGQLPGPADVVVPNDVMMVTAVWDGVANTQRIYRNGVEVASRSWDEAATMTWTDTSALLVGGFNAFGSNGFQGALQHPAVWFDVALTEAQIRELYRIGVTPASLPAGDGAVVFPWSTKILDRDDDVLRRVVYNDSDEKVYLCKGPVASLRAGIVLLPGDYWETPRDYGPVYRGELSARHAGAAGAKALAIDQEVL